MKCFECGEVAVAVCRWCFRGQCATHLQAGLDARSRQPTMGCIHDQPGFVPGHKTGSQAQAHAERSGTSSS